MYVNIKKIYQK